MSPPPPLQQEYHAIVLCRDSLLNVVGAGNIWAQLAKTSICLQGTSDPESSGLQELLPAEESSASEGVQIAPHPVLLSHSI